MRGKRTLGQERANPLRNIPAYAGKTRHMLTALTHHEEHPRVCGENDFLNLNLEAGDGTSPRMRGKLRGIGG